MGEQIGNQASWHYIVGMSQKPEVTIPDSAPPSELVIEDITVGDGDEAVKGKNVAVHYVGVAYSTGKQFDASWDRGDTFDFRLGGGQVIAGWDQGVAGMKVGDAVDSLFPLTWAMDNKEQAASSRAARPLSS